MASTASALQRLPLELILAICRLLDPHDLFCLRTICRTLHDATTTLSLWQYHAALLAQTIPLQPPPPRSPTATQHDQRTALEASLLHAFHLQQRWNTSAAQPRTCYRTRAHIDRITCLKLVLGPLQPRTHPQTPAAPCYTRKRWLITGAVDGFVRVWDLTAPLPDFRTATSSRDAQQPAAPSFNRPPPPFRSPSGGGADDDYPTKPKTSRSSSISSTSINASTGAAIATLPTEATLPPITSTPRRRKLEHLVAEIDTGGDVTALDALLAPDGRSIHIAVGSYYSTAGCLVYVLDLTTKPTVLDCRGALDPPQWCGTQCVSILGDKVAVGTYTGLLHIFDWKTGWRDGIERSDRSSTAAVKLFDHHLLAVGRLGVVELFALPTKHEKEAIDGARQQSSGREIAAAAAALMTTSSSLLSIEDPRSTSLVSTSASVSSSSLSAISSGSIAALTASNFESGTRTSSDNQSSSPQQQQQQARSGPTAPLYRFPILEGNKPLLSVSFGEVRAATFSSRRAPTNVEVHSPLALFALDLGGLTHLEFHPAVRSSEDESDENDKQFPYRFPPSIFSRQSLTGERLIGAAAGASGKRGILLSSLGGVPPTCSVRGYSSCRVSAATAGEDGKDTHTLLQPLLPTPNVSLPVVAPSPSPSAAAATAVGINTPWPVSTSTLRHPMRRVAYEGSRADILTEVAMDEESGLVCIATARGVVWAADYGEDPRVDADADAEQDGAS